MEGVVSSASRSVCPCARRVFVMCRVFRSSCAFFSREERVVMKCLGERSEAVRIYLSDLYNFPRVPVSLLFCLDYFSFCCW